MKIAVIAPIAFVVGLAGSTFAMKKSPAAPATVEADSGHVAADSSTAKHDTAAVTPDSSAASHDSTAAPADTTAHAEAPSQPVKPVPLPVTTPPAGAVAAPASTVNPDFKRLAAILGKLSAEEAAPLLEHFSDAEVEGVLRRMDVTRVAALLAALPKERSAVLGKRLLLSGAGSPK